MSFLPPPPVYSGARDGSGPYSAAQSGPTLFQPYQPLSRTVSGSSSQPLPSPSSRGGTRAVSHLPGTDDLAPDAESASPGGGGRQFHSADEQQHLRGQLPSLLPSPPRRFGADGVSQSGSAPQSPWGPVPAAQTWSRPSSAEGHAPGTSTAPFSTLAQQTSGATDLGTQTWQTMGDKKVADVSVPSSHEVEPTYSMYGTDQQQHLGGWGTDAYAQGGHDSNADVYGGEAGATYSYHPTGNADWEHQYQYNHEEGGAYQQADYEGGAAPSDDQFNQWAGVAGLTPEQGGWAAHPEEGGGTTALAEHDYGGAAELDYAHAHGYDQGQTEEPHYQGSVSESPNVAAGVVGFGSFAVVQGSDLEAKNNGENRASGGIVQNDFRGQLRKSFPPSRLPMPPPPRSTDSPIRAVFCRDGKDPRPPSLLDPGRSRIPKPGDSVTDLAAPLLDENEENVLESGSHDAVAPPPMMNPPPRMDPAGSPGASSSESSLATAPALGGGVTRNGPALPFPQPPQLSGNSAPFAPPAAFAPAPLIMVSPKAPAEGTQVFSPRAPASGGESQANASFNSGTMDASRQTTKNGTSAVKKKRRRGIVASLGWHLTVILVAVFLAPELAVFTVSSAAGAIKAGHTALQSIERIPDIRAFPRLAGWRHVGAPASPAAHGESVLVVWSGLGSALIEEFRVEPCRPSEHAAACAARQADSLAWRLSRDAAHGAGVTLRGLKPVVWEWAKQRPRVAAAFVHVIRDWLSCLTQKYEGRQCAREVFGLHGLLPKHDTRTSPVLKALPVEAQHEEAGFEIPDSFSAHAAPATEEKDDPHTYIGSVDAPEKVAGGQEEIVYPELQHVQEADTEHGESDADQTLGVAPQLHSPAGQDGSESGGRVTEHGFHEQTPEVEEAAVNAPSSSEVSGQDDSQLLSVAEPAVELGVPEEQDGVVFPQDEQGVIEHLTRSEAPDNHDGSHPIPELHDSASYHQESLSTPPDEAVCQPGVPCEAEETAVPAAPTSELAADELLSSPTAEPTVSVPQAEPDVALSNNPVEPEAPSLPVETVAPTAEEEKQEQTAVGQHANIVPPAGNVWQEGVPESRFAAELDQGEAGVPGTEAPKSQVPQETAVPDHHLVVEEPLPGNKELGAVQPEASDKVLIVARRAIKDWLAEVTGIVLLTPPGLLVPLAAAVALGLLTILFLVVRPRLGPGRVALLVEKDVEIEEDVTSDEPSAVSAESDLEESEEDESAAAPSGVSQRIAAAASASASSLLTSVLRRGNGDAERDDEVSSKARAGGRGRKSVVKATPRRPAANDRASQISMPSPSVHSMVTRRSRLTTENDDDDEEVTPAPRRRRASRLHQ